MALIINMASYSLCVCVCQVLAPHRFARNHDRAGDLNAAQKKQKTKKKLNLHKLGALLKAPASLVCKLVDYN